ncbi:MAG: hypothetical protein HYU66_05530 [Armatimonadetes bacterium]|nr:hypothetical protein [Armatimonadota bacterium]
MKPWHLRLLGGFGLERNGLRLGRLKTRKAELLLALLALHSERRFPRGDLVDLLWPELDPGAGRNTLSTTLYFLRRVLEPEPEDRGAYLVADRQAIGLAPRAVESDAAVFQAAARHAAQAESGADRLHLLRLAANLYTGELLPEHDEDWVRDERRRLADQYGALLVRLSEAFCQAGEPLAATEQLERGAALVPGHEDLHRELIRCHLEAGEPEAALRAYQRFEASAARGLAPAPGAATRAMLHRIEALGVPVDPPSTTSLESVSHCLAAGSAALERGEMLTALSWYAEAYWRDHRAEGEAVHRLRLGLVWRHCPRLSRFWPENALVTSLGVDAGARAAAIGRSDGAVRLVHLTAEPNGFRLRGHTAPVVATAFSADGTKLLTVSADGRGRRWEVAVGRPAGPWLKNGGSVTAAALGADGGRAAMAGADGRLHLWDPATGATVGDGLADLGQNARVAFSLDCQLLCAFGHAGLARVLDAGSGRTVTPPLRHPAPVLAAAFGPAGRTLLTACSDGLLRLWSVPEGSLLQTAEGPHQKGIAWLSAEPAGVLAVSLSLEGVGAAWALPSLAERGVLRLNERVAAVASDPSSGHVAVAGVGGTVRVWAPAAPMEPETTLPHGSRVNLVAVGAGGRRILAGGDDRAIRLWERTTGEDGAWPLALRHPAKVHLSRAQFSPCGRYVATGGGDGRARIWDAATGRPCTPFLGHDGPVWDVAFSPRARYLATAGRDAVVRVWDASTGAAVAELAYHRESVRVVRFLSGGDVLLSASRDGTAGLWDWPQRRLMAVLPHRSALRSATVSPDGRWVATATNTGQAGLWEAATGRLVRELPEHAEDVAWVLFSPDGQWVITCGSNGTVQRCSVPDGRLAGQRLRHSGSVQHACVSATDDVLLTVTADGCGRLWSLTEWAAIGPALRHRDWVIWCAMAPVGGLAATCGDDGTAHLWELGNGSPVGPPLAHPSLVNHLSFDPTGSRLATACSDGAARIWDLRVEPWDRDQWRRQAVGVTGMHAAAGSALTPVPLRDQLSAWRQTARQTS